MGRLQRKEYCYKLHPLPFQSFSYLFIQSNYSSRIILKKKIQRMTWSCTAFWLSGWRLWLAPCLLASYLWQLSLTWHNLSLLDQARKLLQFVKSWSSQSPCEILSTKAEWQKKGLGMELKWYWPISGPTEPPSSHIMKPAATLHAYILYNIICERKTCFKKQQQLCVGS